MSVKDAYAVARFKRAVCNVEFAEAEVREPIIERAHPAGAGAAAELAESVYAGDIVVLCADCNIAVVFESLNNAAHHGGIFIDVNPLRNKGSRPRRGYRVAVVIHIGFGEGFVLDLNINLCLLRNSLHCFKSNVEVVYNRSNGFCFVNIGYAVLFCIADGGIIFCGVSVSVVACKCFLKGCLICRLCFLKSHFGSFRIKLHILVFGFGNHLECKYKSIRIGFGHGEVCAEHSFAAVNLGGKVPGVSAVIGKYHPVCVIACCNKSSCMNNVAGICGHAVIGRLGGSTGSPFIIFP